jgi:hypothetical protein
MKTLLTFCLLSFAAIANAQLSRTITEEEPFESDGIEYGYAIRNASTRQAGKQDFARFEVTLYATNKSDCSRVIFFGQGHNLPENENELRFLAKFDCVNATGARLTVKSGQVDAKPMFVNAKVQTRDEKGRFVTEMQKVQVGYYIGAGESVETNVIFIVPLNAKPDIRLRTVNRVSAM